MADSALGKIPPPPTSQSHIRGGGGYRFYLVSEERKSKSGDVCISVKLTCEARTDGAATGIFASWKVDNSRLVEMEFGRKGEGEFVWVGLVACILDYVEEKNYLRSKSPA